MPRSSGPCSTHVHAILGAHRSGTSWLAGSLQEQGLELGEVNTAARFNQKGNRESERLWRIHERILAASGGSWREPPREVVVPAAELAELRAYVDEMNARYERWGFKDPRTLLLLDTWRGLVPPGPACVGVYRHPLAVARSLAAREPDAIDEAGGVRLWLAYNERLVAEHRRAPFPIVRFDTDAGRLHAASAEVARAWQLPLAGDNDAFFDPGLRHADTDAGAPVPRSCRDCWGYLTRHTIGAG